MCVFACQNQRRKAEYTHKYRLHTSNILSSLFNASKAISKLLSCYKMQNHNGIKSSSGNNVCAGADSFHLFSLK